MDQQHRRPDHKNNNYAAPAVYRPQPTPKVLQRKPAQPLMKGRAALTVSAAPPYRPQPKKIVQPQLPSLTPTRQVHGPRSGVNAATHLHHGINCGACRKPASVAVQMMRRRPEPTALTFGSSMAIVDKNVKPVALGIERYTAKNPKARTGKFVVLFGEANFDFAVQYAARHQDYRIVATEYRSFQQLVQQEGYDRFQGNVATLAADGVIVLFGVNAKNKAHWDVIEKRYRNDEKSKIQKVQWNDPHTSTYGEVQSETDLMAGFFDAASATLDKDAKLKMTYAGWPYVPSPSKEGQVDLSTIGSKSFEVGERKGVTRGKYQFNPRRTIGGNINDRLTYDDLSKQTFKKK